MSDTQSENFQPPFKLDEEQISTIASQYFQLAFSGDDWQKFHGEFYSKLHDVACEMVNQVLDHKQTKIKDSTLAQWGNYFVVKLQDRKVFGKVKTAYFKTEEEANEYIFFKDPESAQGWTVQKVEQISRTFPEFYYEDIA